MNQIDILKEVDEVILVDSKRCRWPNIAITEHQVVVGRASHKILRFVVKIREIQRDLKDQTRKCDKLPFTSRDEFYTEIISPLKDMLFILNSMLKLQLRLEFSDLLDKADIGVGRDGKAFWWNIPGKSPYGCGYKRLIDDVINETDEE